MRTKPKEKKGFKAIISILLSLTLTVGVFPVSNVFATQISDYVDPADNWLKTNSRTNELDMNATVTTETQWCPVCNKTTAVLTYRVPEYTKSGVTAMNHGVFFSDGMNLDGTVKGNTDSGTPGVDAYYTGYHFTKTICQNCGTLNTVDGSGAYNFDKNVYSLNSCDHSFFVDFDNTTYEPLNGTYHTTTLKKGEYCQFCKGTYAVATEKKELHDFKRKIDGQIGNNRFYLTEDCIDCQYERHEYVTAKAIVTSYYGVADGNAHTLTVSDLSDNGVTTSIRYGDSAERCTRTSAPNYTEVGYYTVYYQITYSYENESMSENGVGYVWLMNDSSNDDNNQTVTQPETHEHDFRYLETIPPTCDNLGYERWQCGSCGALEKKNYTPATGHAYENITVREATCEQGGLVLSICKSCGDFYQTTTPNGEHHYHTNVISPDCKSVGYKEHICEVCGDTYITDITPIIPHSFEKVTKQPTCTEKGYTTSTCIICGISFVSDYIDPTGHDWDDGHTVTSSTCEGEGVIEYHCNNCDEKMIKATSATGHTPGEAVTCTEPQVCEVCGTVLELPTGHHYDSEVIAPTCTSMGYTVYTCRDCGDTYTGDYTDKAEHDYNTVATAPTCTSHGYTTYSCKNCDDEYVSDYTEKLAHNYKEDATKPTCTSMGFSTFTCADCGDSYVGNYTDMLEHNYNKETVEPTCTEHGYAVYTCPDCGKSYIGDYTDSKEHHYIETVIAPTCTEMGYSIFKCDDCGDEYKGNYTDKVLHDYEKNVTAPTCTELGFTTYTCSNCGDTYKADYKEQLGHTPSEWIVDISATIENAGSKHIECERCGEILQTAEIARLIDKDNSDEDGNAEVGDYSIILTDKNGKPIFNSEITIDVNDNVTIKLPEGRLLDFADQTTIIAFYTDTQAAKSDLQIFIYDEKNNAATGKTNAEGQLKVPNNQSSTGDDNGTVGKDDGEEKQTFVVTVTDKTNTVIPNCDIYIGESNNLVVDLPEGIKPTREYPVIITVTDQNGNAHADITIIALGDNDYIEKGVTDIYGKVTLPITSEGYTDGNGKVNVENINVIVNDEIGVIPNAYVIHNEDGTIHVTLPDEKTISYVNRITVTVLDSIGKAIADMTVTVADKEEKTYTANTNENGVIIVPPLSEDMTDSEGNAVVNGYNVFITDETKPIENAFVTIADGKINVVLPDEMTFDYSNRITATVTDKDNNPVKDMSVTFTDSTENSETNLTDENGRATVPPVNIDYTDVNGYSEVDGYIVTVINETGAIEKAFVTHNAEVKNEDGTVETAESITVELPENIVFDYNNRITVTVLNKAEQTAVQDMNITVSEKAVTTDNLEETADVKSLSGVTNNDGKAVFPPLSEDITDDNGSSDITEEKPGKGEDTDGDGVEDKPGETETVTYKVSVNDTKGIINNAFVEIKNGKIYVTLPDTHTLTTSNQTTVTVLDKDGNAVSGISVTITDKTNTSKTGTTNSSGKVTLPVKSSGGGSSSGGSSGGGGGSYSSYSTVNVKVTDKDGKTVSVTKSVDSKGNITVTLPTGKVIDSENYYTVTVTDSKGAAKADTIVILKDRNNGTATGITDENGMLTLPAKEHKAYIVGYPDGTFRPDGDMSRAEAAAIFARLISEEKGESINGKPSFADVNSNEWYGAYIGYLEKYNIIKGYTDGTFKPNASVTRAEFVAMAVRYYSLFNEVKTSGYTVKYTDVTSDYWAYSDIAIAKNIGWLNGYSDGSFRGDNDITRAEVVTVVNRATGRVADKEYVKDNFTKLNRFTDVTDSSMWYFFDVVESCNDHMAVTAENSEIWVK